MTKYLHKTAGEVNPDKGFPPTTCPHELEAERKIGRVLSNPTLTQGAKLSQIKRIMDDCARQKGVIV